MDTQGGGEMKEIPTWKPTAPIPDGCTLLLEASAGTGKTWQMASLVTRLVAEYGLPIHEILVITFTNAAAAELRDRVRRRLVEARDALEGDLAPSADPVLAHLWSTEDLRGERRRRLAAALSDFDRAPISTIHGFCQRTLDQLAFESGQEPGLELLADPSALREELVNDTLAGLYVTVRDAGQLEVLASMGFDRAELSKLAKEMTEAVAPELIPAAPAADDMDPVRLLDRWLEEVSRFAKWLDEGEGAEAYNAIVAELQRKKGKRFDGRRLQLNRLNNDVNNLRAWLAAGAPASRKLEDNKEFNYANLFLARYAEVWKDQDDTDGRDNFEGRAFYAGCQSFFEMQDALVGQARAAFASRARRWLHSELERRAVLTYDTMLSRLSERVGLPEEGPQGPLARAIRDRYKAALIDEFQDTDGAQWNVLQTVFAQPDRRLVIVGDPKQAIYGFRGADVHVYLLAAKSKETERYTMKVNWRSDRPYVEAMNRFWPDSKAAFCRDDVRYVEVDAKQDRRLFDLPPVEEPDGHLRARCPFELRWLDGGAQGDPGEPISNVADGETLAAKDCALQAAELLKVEHASPWAMTPGPSADCIRATLQCSSGRTSKLNACGLRWPNGRFLRSAAAKGACL